jgi:hypothetical protein
MLLITSGFFEICVGDAADLVHLIDGVPRPLRNRTSRGKYHGILHVQTPFVFGLRARALEICL